MSDQPFSPYRQSAVVPLLGGKIVMITSLKRKRWILPKGIVEPDLSAADSAAKEAFEEAGVTGSVRPDSIGYYAYEKWGGVCRVEVFVLDVEELLDQWDEREHRHREVVTIAEATDRVEEPELKRILERLA